MDKYNCGIYLIINIKNDKIYVGSSKDIKRRWKVHKNFLRQNKHKNQHLQNAWNNYNEENFVFKQILICEPKDLIMYEQIFLDYYDSSNSDKGYNLQPIAASRLGMKASEETKKKMSEWQKGQPKQKSYRGS